MFQSLHLGDILWQRTRTFVVDGRNRGRIDKQRGLEFNERLTVEQRENEKGQGMTTPQIKQERYEYVVKELKRYKRMGWAADWSADWKRLKAEKAKLKREVDECLSLPEIQVKPEERL